MKNKIALGEYVDDIIKELPYSKYTSRFREELLEHLEDSEKEFTNDVKTDTFEKTIEKLGQKILLIQDYNDFYRGTHPKRWFITIAFYVFLSFLVSYIASAPLGQFKISYFYSDYSASTGSSLITVLFSILFALAVNHAFYKFIAARLSIHLESDKRKKKFLFIFFLLPFISIILTAFLRLSYNIEQENTLELIFYLLPFLCAFLPALVAFEIILKKRKPIISDTKLPYLTLIGFWILIILIVASEKFPYATLPHVLGNLKMAFYELHFLIFFLIDIMAMIPNLMYLGISDIDTFSSSSLLGSSPQQVVNQQIIEMATYVGAVFLAGTLFVYSARKRKDIVSKHWTKAVGLILISYSLFMILPIKSLGGPQIDWKVPEMELSRHIEKKQFGIFYDIIKFKNNNEGYIFNYDSCNIDDNFVAVQSSGYVFTTDLKNISSVDEIETIRTEAQVQENYCPKPAERAYEATSTFFFQEGWKCLDENDNILSTENRNALNGCTKIAYNDREVLKGSMCPVRSIDMSTDKSWGLIRMACIYGVDKLHLVDLRELK